MSLRKACPRASLHFAIRASATPMTRNWSRPATPAKSLKQQKSLDLMMRMVNHAPVRALHTRCHSTGMSIMRQLCAFTALLFLSATPLSAQEHKPPNIVILYADDIGYGDLSCYGHP